MALPTLVAATAKPAGAVAVGGPRRLLVISIPGLGWRDVTDETTPNLRAFLEDAAIAGLSTRVSHRLTEPGEAYVTIGAANRAVADDAAAAAALAPDESYGTGTAAEEFQRLTGEPMTGAAA